MNNKNAELFAGLFVIIGFVVMGSLILNFGRLQEKFDDQYSLTVVFKTASGLIDGSEVRMGGAKVGRVIGKPKLDDQGAVSVKLSIYEVAKIPVESKFSVVQASLLGDMRVDITRPQKESSSFIAEGAIVKGEDAKGIAAVSKKIEGIVDETNLTLVKVKASLDEVEQTLKSLNSITAKVDKRVLSSENLNNIDQLMVSLAEISKEANVAIKDLAPLLKATQSAALSTDKLASSLQTQSDELGPEMSKLLKKASSLMDTLNALDEKPGVIAALINDPEMREDTKVLLKNLREHGILRYKDGEKKRTQPKAFTGQR